jgi:hypothetical protein
MSSDEKLPLLCSAVRRRTATIETRTDHNANEQGLSLCVMMKGNTDPVWIATRQRRSGNVD